MTGYCGGMADLPSVNPLPPQITPAVLAAVLQGLEPGEYTVAALWPRYMALFWATESMCVMSTSQHLGMALKRAGFAWRTGHNHANIWIIDRERLEAVLRHAEGTVSETPSGTV